MLVERIKELCKQKGMSIRELERKCGLGHATIAKWDKSSPTLKNLKTVANQLDVPVCELVELCDE